LENIPLFSLGAVPADAEKQVKVMIARNTECENAEDTVKAGMLGCSTK